MHLNVNNVLFILLLFSVLLLVLLSSQLILTNSFEKHSLKENTYELDSNKLATVSWHTWIKTSHMMINILHTLSLKWLPYTLNFCSRRQDIVVISGNYKTEDLWSLKTVFAIECNWGEC